MSRATNLLKSLRSISEQNYSDSVAMRELELFMDNDAQLYKTRYMPILKNLSKKMKKGVYDQKLAAKLFLSFVDDGAKKYSKEYSDGKDWNTMFIKKDRLLLATEYAKDFEDKFKNKEFDFMEDNYEEETWPQRYKRWNKMLKGSDKDKE